MSQSLNLSQIISNQAIQDFAFALRKALRENEDYASLIELEYMETKEQFLDTIKRFLRRYESYARKLKRKKPEEKSLIELANLVDRNGVKPIRAALIALALCKGSTQEKVE